jgi:hypothetical protein
VIDQQPFSGPVTLDIDGEQRIVGHDLAQQLLCVRGSAA